VFHGPLNSAWTEHPLSDALPIERFAVAALLFVIVLVGVYPGIVSTMIGHGVEPIAALFTT
jgi:NADH:ubiquinone oxidoreductase subunit 4 (subunit M)